MVVDDRHELVMDKVALEYSLPRTRNSQDLPAGLSKPVAESIAYTTAAYVVSTIKSIGTAHDVELWPSGTRPDMTTGLLLYAPLVLISNR
jgi:hypothetical protein